MSTPNPLAPQGSLLEQQAKGRSTFHVISFIGAVHVMLLCGILWTACSKDETPKTETKQTIGNDPYLSPPPDNTGLGTAGSSGAIPPPPAQITSNPPVASSSLPPAPATYPIPTPLQPPAVVPPVMPPAQDPAPIASVAGEYKVVAGDIGGSIARKNGVSLAALVAANPGVNWNRLKAGQSIQIPAGGGNAAPGGSAPAAAPSATSSLVYIVKAGDTGTKIAARHGLKWVEIRRASGLKSDTLRPGQKLTIPNRTAATPADASAPVALPPGGGSTAPTAVPIPPAPR